MVIISNHIKFCQTFSSHFLINLQALKGELLSSNLGHIRRCNHKSHSSSISFNKILRRTLHIQKIAASAEMANQQKTLEHVERTLNNWLKPQILGESWDNIGLLVGSGKYEKNEKLISSIMLCNDLMPAVLDEAVSKKADLILAYHPPIFSGMKAISYGSWKERIVARCLANDICIYSPHTTLDSTIGGINDRVLNALKTGTNKTSPMRAIIPSSFVEAETKGASFMSTSENIGKLLEAIPFQQYSDVLITLSTCGQDATLSVYSKSSLDSIRNFVSGLEISGLNVCKSDDKPIFGAGRIIELNDPIELDNAVEAIKTHLDLGYVQLAYGGNPVVKSAAVCVGSGSSLLKPIAGKVDLLITGEMSHHDILECVAKKSSVILCNHCSSERHYLPDLAETLKVVTGVNNVFVSEEDCSPLRLVL